MSEKSVSAKLAESFDRSKKAGVCEIKEYCSKKKVAPNEPMEITKEIIIKAAKIHETHKAESKKGDKDDKMAPIRTPDESPIKDIKPNKVPVAEVTKVCETLKKESPKDIKLETAEIPTKATKMLEILKPESTKNVEDDKPVIPTKDSEKSYVKTTQPVEVLEAIKVHEMLKRESPKDNDIEGELKTITETLCLIEVLQNLHVEDVKDDSSEISAQDPEESTVKNIKSAEDANKTKKIPVLRKVV